MIHPAAALVAVAAIALPAVPAAAAPSPGAAVATSVPAEAVSRLLVGGLADPLAVGLVADVTGVAELGAGVWSVDVAGTDRLGAVARTLLERDLAAWAEPDAVLQGAAQPDDPGMDLLWGLGVVPGGIADVDAPEAWATTTGSAQVVVAVVDSGIDVGHPDLASRIWSNPDEVAGNGIDDDRNGLVDDVRGWDFVDDDASVYAPGGSEHGTHVAGTVAAAADGRGVVGVAPGVRLLPLRTLDGDGSGHTSDAVAAIAYAAAAGARVVNASWGSPDASRALREVIHQTGILVVAATGNAGGDIDQTPAYPAAYDLPNVLSVTAVAEDGSIPAFANVGAVSADVGAPGVDVVSTAPDGGFAYSSGTSMAAPHASGVAALLASVAPAATGTQLADWVRRSARPHEPLRGRTATGGLVDADDALALALGATAEAGPANRTSGEADAVAEDTAATRTGSPTARDVSATCADRPAAGFTDTAGTTHEATIDCVAAHDVARGRADGTFGPGLALGVGQTAAFLRRALAAGGHAVPDATGRPCGDAAGTHVPDLAALVAAGIAPTRACAEQARPITRGEMATWVSRALDHAGRPAPTATGTWFDDDAGHAAEVHADRVADLGIVTGLGARTFGPDAQLSRAQMATFLARLLDVLQVG